MVAAAGGAGDPWTGAPIVSLCTATPAATPASERRGLWRPRGAGHRSAGPRQPLLDLSRDGGMVGRGGVRRGQRGVGAGPPQSAGRRGDRRQPAGAGLRILRRRLPPAGAPRPDVRRADASGGEAGAAGRRRPRSRPVSGWDRATPWPASGRAWIAPGSPNMPASGTALIYPGACLVEATELSEGRGTTRPFHLAGAPSLDAVALADCLNGRRLPGVTFLPTYFRPQFQKHKGAVCGGVEWVTTDAACAAPLSHRGRAAEGSGRGGAGAARLAAGRLRICHRPAGDRSAVRRCALPRGPRRGWRRARRLDGEAWSGDEEEFRRERQPILLYLAAPAPAGRRRRRRGGWRMERASPAAGGGGAGCLRAAPRRAGGRRAARRVARVGAAGRVGGIGRVAGEPRDGGGWRWAWRAPWR